ncbi:hypothetical protein ACSZNK_10805 [Aeromonas hydrophila]
MQATPVSAARQPALLIKAQQVSRLRLVGLAGLGGIEQQPRRLDGAAVAAPIPAALPLIGTQGQQHLPAVRIVELGPRLALSQQQGCIVLNEWLLLQTDLCQLPPLALIEGAVPIPVGQQEQCRLLFIQSQGRCVSAPGQQGRGAEIGHPGRRCA